MLVSSGLVFAFAAATGAVSLTTPVSQSSTTNINLKNVVFGAYIVELTPESSLGRRAGVNTDAHNTFHRRASAIDYSVRRQFTNPELFYGLSIDVRVNATDTELQELLSSIDGVAAVWPVKTYGLLAPTIEEKRVAAPETKPNPQAERPVKRRCVPRPSKSTKIGSSTSATSTTTSSTTSTSTLVSGLPKITGTSDLMSSYGMVGIGKVHAMGIRGRGMKIGIIDTGVDYRHPSLGGGFGPGFKIAGGHAYRDDSGKAVDIADPLTTCLTAGHGTHVAGIVGMEDGDDYGFGLVGVAPDAEIYMYRVFGCSNSYGATNDDILAALAQAQADGVDVVSMSLGSELAWEIYDPFASMTSALVANGIAVMAAAGNDGLDGLFNPSDPAGGANVISVGSVESRAFPVVYSAIDSTGASIPYAAVWPLSTLGIPSEGLSVYILGDDGSGCDESSWITASQAVADFNSTIIVFSNGDDDSCGLSDKMSYWAKYGFRYIMDYTTEQSASYEQQYTLLEQDDNSTVYANLQNVDGLLISSNYASAGGYPHYKMSFTDQTVTSTAMVTGGSMSYFSSFGPSWDTLSLKPQLSAPGASILSTWPLGFNAGYAALRGTSMATPLIAASYALVKSQLPSLSVQEIRERLQSTSSPTSTYSYPSLFQTVAQQGAGLINVFNAIAYNSTVSPTEFPLGSIDDYLGTTFNFTITNNGLVEESYQIKHNGAAMMEYLPFGVHPFQAEDPLWETQPEYDTYATVDISTYSVTIPAGESVTIGFTVTPPDVEASTVPVISGFITIESSHEQFNLPYLGLPYSRRNQQYIDLSNYTVSTNATPSVPWPVVWERDPRYGNVTYYAGGGIIQLDKKPAIINEFEVGLLYHTLQASHNMRVDLLGANTTFVPTHYGYDPTVELDYYLTTEPYRNHLVDGITPTYGLIGGANFEPPFLALASWSNFDVVVDNDDYEDEGGVAPTQPGDYRMLLSVLRLGGNATNLNDYETWLSPIIRLVDSGRPDLGLPGQAKL